MDVAQIEGIGKQLRKFMREFSDCFERSEPREHAHTYVCGQFSNLPRKSVEPMADHAGIEPRALQRFLSERVWDEAQMTSTLHRIIARDHADPHAIGVIDETSFAKKGRKTPGVQRQHCGATGKTDNCAITVHLGYAVNDFHCLLSSALYLPESWSSDRKRCNEARIPQTLVYRPKWQIALELHQQSRDEGVRFEWLTADEDYGRIPEFHAELSRRNQFYVVEVPRNFWCWPASSQIVDGQQEWHSDGNAPIFKIEKLAAHSRVIDQEWQRFHIKDGTKGPIVWEVKSVQIYLRGSDGLPTAPHWLIVARNVLDREEIKFFVSNAPPKTGLEPMLYVGFNRWHVERCFEDEKTELGMDHFEVRTYRAMMRHLTLTAASHLFAARIRQNQKKRSWPDRVPGPNRRECVSDGARAARCPSSDHSRARCESLNPDTPPQYEVRAQPSQENTSTPQKDRDLRFEVTAL